MLLILFYHNIYSWMISSFRKLTSLALSMQTRPFYCFADNWKDRDEASEKVFISQSESSSLLMQRKPSSGFSRRLRTTRRNKSLISRSSNVSSPRLCVATRSKTSLWQQRSSSSTRTSSDQSADNHTPICQNSHSVISIIRNKEYVTLVVAAPPRNFGWTRQGGYAHYGFHLVGGEGGQLFDSRFYHSVIADWAQLPNLIVD